MVTIDDVYPNFVIIEDIDEDYESFGLSGELSAVVMEAGLTCKYARVCTQATIPYARHLEEQILPNRERICTAVRQLD